MWHAVKRWRSGPRSTSRASRCSISGRPLDRAGAAEGPVELVPGQNRPPLQLHEQQRARPRAGWARVTRALTRVSGVSGSTLPGPCETWSKITAPVSHPRLVPLLRSARQTGSVPHPENPRPRIQRSVAEHPETIVFTDGACIGNPGPGAWAWASTPEHYEVGCDPSTTNQRMELSAVLQALRAHAGAVHIVSDSTYVVHCFRDRWWEGWRRRNWKNSKGEQVANQDLWRPLISLVIDERPGEIRFSWVKGHAGDPMNALVDQLANDAARTQQPSPRRAALADADDAQNSD